MLKEGKNILLLIFGIILGVITIINFTQTVVGQSSQCVFYTDPIFPYFGSPDDGGISANEKFSNYFGTDGIKDQVESNISVAIQSQDSQFSPLGIIESISIPDEFFLELELTNEGDVYNSDGFAPLFENLTDQNLQYFGVGVPCNSEWSFFGLEKYDIDTWLSLYHAPFNLKNFEIELKNNYPDSIPLLFVDAFLNVDGNSCGTLGRYGLDSRIINFKSNPAIIKNYTFNGTIFDGVSSILSYVLAHEIGHAFSLGHNYYDDGLFEGIYGASHNLMVTHTSNSEPPPYFTESQSCLVRRLCHNPELMRLEVYNSVGPTGYGLTAEIPNTRNEKCGGDKENSISLLNGFQFYYVGYFISFKNNESCETIFTSGNLDDGGFDSGIDNYFTSNCEFDNPLADYEYVEEYGKEDNKYKEWCYKDLPENHPIFVSEGRASSQSNSCRKVEFCGDGYFDEDVEECDPSANVSNNDLIFPSLSIPNPSCQNPDGRCFPEQGQVCLMEGEGVDKKNCIAENVCFDDVMLVIDRSGSMGCSVSLDGQGCFESEVQCNACGGIWNGPINDAKAASIQFVESVNLNISRIGVTSFADSAILDAPLTNDSEILINAINAIEAGGGTDIASGINTGGIGLELFETPENNKTMILLSDGDQNSGDASSAANALKDLGVEIYAIGLGDANQALLQDIASDAEHYFYSPSSGELEQIFEEIAECSPEFHNGCYGNYCIVIPGPGDDECSDNDDCT